MPEEIELIENANALEEKLREILIAGSLYRIFAYTGEACHFQSSGGTYSAVRALWSAPQAVRNELRKFGKAARYYGAIPAAA